VIRRSIVKKNRKIKPDAETRTVELAEDNWNALELWKIKLNV
jgi:hypothetical protein